MFQLLGYVSDVTPIKTLKHLKRKYFNFVITDNGISNLGVCFSPEKHNGFPSI